MNELSLFNFGAHEVRELEKDGQSWFVAKDICEALGFGNHRQAITTHVPEEDRGVQILDTLGGKQELTFVNESGLYALIFGSTKPEAKAFKRWVTHEVLPSIRKQGFYKLEREVAELKDKALNAHEWYFEARQECRDLQERYTKKGSILHLDEREKIKESLRNGISIMETARVFGRARRTIQMIKKQMEVGA